MCRMPKAVLPSLTLCAFRVEMPRGEEAGAPTRLLVLPKGEHDVRKRGKVICSDVTLTGFTAMQQAIKRTRLALDFEHNTVPGMPAYLADKEPRSIAAWADAVPTPLGIEFTNIEWTPAGLEAWKNKSFQDLSPTCYRAKDGTVLALHSVALCRHGELDGLTIQAASAIALSADIAQLTALSASNETTEIMKPTPALIALLTALSVTLSETADEAAVETALLEGAKKIEELSKAKPEAMSAELVALTAEVKQIRQGQESGRRTALMAEAAAAGKVIPLSQAALELVSLSILEDMVKTAKPGQVPVKSDNPGGHQNGGEPEAFSAESMETFARYGLSEEDVKPKK